MIVFKVIFSMLSFALGSSCASFAYLMACRIPKGISIIKPNSYCEKCQKTIKPIDNIPILSWIILGGRCRYCKNPIGAFSLVLEFFGGVSFLLIYLQYGRSYKDLITFASLIILLSLFLIIAAIDYETREIYNVTLFLFALVSIFISVYRVAVLGNDPWSHIGGAALGFGFFGLIKLIAKAMLKRDALGSGDVYLVGIGGLMLGIFPLLMAILLGSLLGLCVECIRIKAKRSRVSEEIAFGPYLLFGIAIMSIYGDLYMRFYWEVIINAFV